MLGAMAEADALASAAEDTACRRASVLVTDCLLVMLIVSWPYEVGEVQWRSI